MISIFLRRPDGRLVPGSSALPWAEYRRVVRTAAKVARTIIERAKDARSDNKDGSRQKSGHMRDRTRRRNRVVAVGQFT